jgi:hypothetical protein
MTSSTRITGNGFFFRGEDREDEKTAAAGGSDASAFYRCPYGRTLVQGLSEISILC